MDKITIPNKVRIDFENWYLKWYYANHPNKKLIKKNDGLRLKEFHIFPFEMQKGVFEAYFEDADIIIDIHPILCYDNEKYTSVKEYIGYAHRLNEIISLGEDEDIIAKSKKECTIITFNKALEIRDKQLKL